MFNMLRGIGERLLSQGTAPPTSASLPLAPSSLACCDSGHPDLPPKATPPRS
jgi:hypothetical protein